MAVHGGALPIHSTSKHPDFFFSCLEAWCTSVTMCSGRGFAPSIPPPWLAGGIMLVLLAGWGGGPTGGATCLPRTSSRSARFLIWVIPPCSSRREESIALRNFEILYRVAELSTDSSQGLFQGCGGPSSAWHPSPSSSSLLSSPKSLWLPQCWLPWALQDAQEK